MIFKTITVVSFALCVLGDGQRATSEQRIKIFDTENKGDLKHIGTHAPEHHEEYAWSYPSYEFSYKVHDPHTHDIKGHQESRHGDEVKGEYWLVQPDGQKRTVTYNADKHSGFKADVKYSDYHHDDKHKIKEEHKEEIKPVEEKEPEEDKKEPVEEKHDEPKEDKKEETEEHWDKHVKEDNVEEKKGDEGHKEEESHYDEDSFSGWRWGARRIEIRGKNDHKDDEKHNDKHHKELNDRKGDIGDHVIIVKNLGSFGRRHSAKGHDESHGHDEKHGIDGKRSWDDGRDKNEAKPARNIPYYVRDPYSHPRFYRRSHERTASSRH